MAKAWQWWTGRLWGAVGACLVLSGGLVFLVALTGIVFALLVRDSASPPLVSLLPRMMRALLGGALWLAVGVLMVYRGHRGLRAMAAEPDTIERVARRVARVIFTRWVLMGVVVAIALGGIGFAIHIPFADRDFVRRGGEVRGFEFIHHVETRETQWGVVLRGTIPPEHIARFIDDNHLALGYGDFARTFAEHEPIAKWQRQWPDEAEWYGRLQPRSKDFCDMCKNSWLLDRRSGQVWIWVNGPDFSGS